MTENFAEVCLKAHNEYRRKHGAQPLLLDREISNVAQRWANNIASRNAMQHSTGTGYGENIYASCGHQVNGKTPVDAWYSEIKDYRYGSGFSMKTGHFTQVVWKGSQKMGVGFATNGKGWTYVVANYYPPGNYANQYSSNVLPPGNYFLEEPKREDSKKKESTIEEHKTENLQIQTTALKLQSEASSSKIRDEILDKIKEYGLKKAQSFCDFICGYLSARYSKYSWIAILADGNPNATYYSGNIAHDFNYVIEDSNGRKTIVNIFQLEKTTKIENVVKDIEKLEVS